MLQPRRQSGTSGSIEELGMNAKQSQQPATASADVEQFHQRLAAALVLLCVLLLSVTTWVVNDVKSTHASTTVEAAAAAHPAPDFEYFPSRYVNQATDAEEHIQAF